MKAQFLVIAVVLAIFFYYFFGSVKKIRYAGFEDVMFCERSLLLYEDNTFWIHIDCGVYGGSYLIKKDSVYLNYGQARDTPLPTQFLMTKDKFIELPTKERKENLTRFQIQASH
ncbi:MAG: hypothetical protein EAZ95_14830 [Bacteroidetes bacterium]|nr:MAG: hypothetical protein EAZ95_14830 [Bacteroidota bacterium]